MRANRPLLHGDITASIIDSFFVVHKELGFGFREYVYTRALERLLIAKGHRVDFGKKARFHRVFFENRFKQRSQCP